MFTAEFFTNLKILSQNLFKATNGNKSALNNNNSNIKIESDKSRDQSQSSLNQNMNQGNSSSISPVNNLTQGPSYRTARRRSRGNNVYFFFVFFFFNLYFFFYFHGRFIFIFNLILLYKFRYFYFYIFYFMFSGSFDGGLIGPLSQMVVPLTGKQKDSFNTSRDSLRESKEREKRGKDGDKDNENMNSKDTMNMNSRDNSIMNNKERESNYFSSESIQDRLRVYAREGGVPLDYVDRYSQHLISKNNENSNSNSAI